ncbi:hypothetical protein Cni_G09639 [Canna indica]|uniref:VTT domain-containing protein n=1 Tax=Canna indica TaxID=4628 RepID=A0AAQ3K8H2_9LILI|nr:hypothetical protein Cni_G09639 [Canna indica]
MAVRCLSPPLALLSHGSSGRSALPLAVRKINFQHSETAITASPSGVNPSSEGDEITEILPDIKVENSNRETLFLVMLSVALGVAVMATLVSIFSKSSTEPFFLLSKLIGGSSESVPVPSSVGYTFKVFGYQIVLPEYTPGWVYFWLLMAAGCGLFISEEALNVWVGISLARNLSLDGSWKSLANSFSSNAPYIVSTILWVYWGVCISDMIPFYLGKLFRQTKASKDISAKLGIGKEKIVSITKVVQKYGKLIGFVERFSVGVRNPTAFLAGAWGISPDCFFAGVCCGCLITLPIQLTIGFLLRERPVVALASVATAVVQNIKLEATRSTWRGSKKTATRDNKTLELSEGTWRSARLREPAGPKGRNSTTAPGTREKGERIPAVDFGCGGRSRVELLVPKKILASHGDAKQRRSSRGDSAQEETGGAETGERKNRRAKI